MHVGPEAQRLFEKGDDCNGHFDSHAKGNMCHPLPEREEARRANAPKAPDGAIGA